MCIGGTLATAGGLVFIGDGDGTLRAYSTRDGEARRSFQTGAGVNAPPITYAVDGKQYIAVASGGSWQLNFPAAIRFGYLRLMVLCRPPNRSRSSRERC